MGQVRTRGIPGQLSTDQPRRYDILGDLNIRQRPTSHLSIPATCRWKTLSKYYVWNDDWTQLPLFAVTPSQGASIVQEIKVYPASEKRAKDPTSYKIEGRANSANEWSLISEGSLPNLGPRLALGLPITVGFADGLTYGKVTFSNTKAYSEYRLWFPTNGGNCCVNQISEVQFGGFLVSSPAVELTTPYPNGAHCTAGAECESGLCNGLCVPAECSANPCFSNCVGLHGSPLEDLASLGYWCGNGCAGMDGGFISDPDKYCSMDQSSRYSTCMTDCDSVSSREGKIAACKDGCAFWNYV